MWPFKRTQSTIVDPHIADAVSAVIAIWNAQGVKLNRGASKAQLRKLASFVGQPLPADIVALYSHTNGMVDYAMDDNHVSIWSIDRIVAERNEVYAPRIGFGDVLISSWYLMLRPTETGFAVDLEAAPDRSFESLRDFLAAYAANADELGF